MKRNMAARTRRGAPRPSAARRPTSKREAEAGFAIGVYDARLIEENAHDRADPRHGDPEWAAEMVKRGLLTKKGGITDKGWDQISKDVERIERNSMAWMKRTFGHVRDDGHDSHDDLVGSFWFDPTNPDQAWLVELASPSPGRSERIDMQDASYGDLANTAFDGVSDFGASVLGGQITFFDVSPEDWETIESSTSAPRRSSGRRSRARMSAPPRRNVGEIRRYGPGKFNYIVDQHIYEMGLNQGADEELSFEHAGWWFAFFTVDPRTREWIRELALEAGDKLTEEENSMIDETVAIILFERSDGIVEVDWYDKKADADKAWRAIEKEYEEAHSDEEEYE
jgi:hypothetical protein